MDWNHGSNLRYLPPGYLKFDASERLNNCSDRSIKITRCRTEFSKRVSQDVTRLGFHALSMCRGTLHKPLLQLVIDIGDRDAGHFSSSDNLSVEISPGKLEGLILCEKGGEAQGLVDVCRLKVGIVAQYLLARLTGSKEAE
jgi:hypothetical protein